MTYYPLPRPSPENEEEDPQQPHHSTRTDSIRPISSEPYSYSYDTYRHQQQEDIDGYREEREEVEEEYGRPPSFRSTTNNQTTSRAGAGAGAGVFLGGDVEDSYASLPIPSREYRTGSTTRVDLDSDLSATPPYVEQRTEGGAYRDYYYEDVKRVEDFEDSFEGDDVVSHSRIKKSSRDIAGEEDVDIMKDFDSPPLSFKGGFGAPPTVSFSFFRLSLSSRKKSSKLIFLFVLLRIHVNSQLI